VKTHLTIGVVPRLGGGDVADLLIVPWSDNARFIRQIGELAGVEISTFLERHGASLRNKKPLALPCVPENQRCRSIVFVPVISANRGDDPIKGFAEQVIRLAQGQRAERVAILIDLLPHASWRGSTIERLVEAAELAQYQFTDYQSKIADSSSVSQLILVSEHACPREIQTGLALAASYQLARDIILTPPNHKRPRDLAERISRELDHPLLSVTVIDRAGLERLGAGGILAVGNVGEPVLVRIEYTPPIEPDARLAARRRPVALVGKGVTMDTGGYALKPLSGQKAMKGDCAGAAAVVGAMRAIALLKPATPVRAYVALVENLIGPGAMLTGDVITTLDKHTVEIMNPDAEGRLILADALALACQEGAGVVIDIATLTGGVVAALGNKRAGVFATSTQLAEAIIRVGGASGERFWRLPLAEEYLPLLEGGIADLRNVASTPGPDATVAALFLREFISPRVSWIHLDIAGPGLGDGMDRGHVAGFGVGTLTRFVCSRG